MLKQGTESIASSHVLFAPFLLFLFTSLLGYVLGWMACMMRMQPVAFSLPLCLATPLCLLIILIQESCSVFFTHIDDCHFLDKHNLAVSLPAAACLYLAQILCTGYFIFKTSTIPMQRESEVLKHTFS